MNGKLGRFRTRRLLLFLDDGFLLDVHEEEVAHDGREAEESQA